MSTIETNKPKKRKRKNEDRRINWWLLIMAFLLLLVLPASLFIYSSVPPAPPTATRYPDPTLTPVFTLNQHCDVTGNTYQVVMASLTGQRTESPNKQYVVEYQDTGVYVSENRADAEPILLTAQIPNVLNQNILWSPDSHYFIFFDSEQQVILADTAGNQRQMLHYALGMLGWSPDSRHVLVTDNDAFWLLPVAGEPRRLTDVTPTNYYIQNWSPNGEYMVMIGNTADYSAKSLTILPIDANRPLTVKDVNVYNQYVEWSPDGQHVVVFPQYADQTKGVRFMSLDGTAQHEFAIPQGMTLAPVPVIWSTDRRKIALYLRPETDNAPQTITIIGLDGTVLPVATIHRDELIQLKYQSSAEPDMTLLHWSSDDHQYRYWADHQLFVFDIPTQTTQTLYVPATTGDIPSLYYVRPIKRLLVLSRYPDTMQLAILDLSGAILTQFDLPITADVQLNPYDWIVNDETFFISFMDIEGRNPYIVNVRDLWAKRLLPETVADMGQLSWSPQGNFVAVTWSDTPAIPGEFNPQRRVYLTILDMNTGDITTLDNDFYSVYDLVWSSDDGQLLYTAWRDTGTTLVVRDMATGTIRQLVDGTNAHYVHYDAAQQHITLWRKIPENNALAFQYDEQQGPFAITPLPNAGNWHYEVYALTGERLYDFVLINVKPNWTALFPAPDGMTIIAKAVGAGYDSQSLQVLDVATGSTHIVTRDLKGLGDPVWSPDGNLVMFTQWTQNRELSMQVIDHTGKPIFSQALDKLYRLAWQKCG